MTTADLPTLGEIEAGDKTFQAMRVLARELLALRDRVERCDEWSVQHGQMIHGQDKRLDALERVQRDADDGEQFVPLTRAQVDRNVEIIRERDSLSEQLRIMQEANDINLAAAVRLHESLRRYGKHAYGCATDTHGGLNAPGPCTCGLAAALASATPAEGGT